MPQDVALQNAQRLLRDSQDQDTLARAFAYVQAAQAPKTPAQAAQGYVPMQQRLPQVGDIMQVGPHSYSNVPTTLSGTPNMPYLRALDAAQVPWKQEAERAASREAAEKQRKTAEAAWPAVRQVVPVVAALNGVAAGAEDLEEVPMWRQALNYLGIGDGSEPPALARQAGPTKQPRPERVAARPSKAVARPTSDEEYFAAAQAPQEQQPETRVQPSLTAPRPPRPPGAVPPSPFLFIPPVVAGLRTLGQEWWKELQGTRG